MYAFFQWLADSFGSIVSLLNRYSFDFGGFYVTLFDILVGMIVLSLVIAVFWKGARS